MRAQKRSHVPGGGRIAPGGIGRRRAGIVGDGMTRR